jgi:hypothetical protein
LPFIGAFYRDLLSPCVCSYAGWCKRERPARCIFATEDRAGVALHGDALCMPYAVALLNLLEAFTGGDARISLVDCPSSRPPGSIGRRNAFLEGGSTMHLRSLPCSFVQCPSTRCPVAVRRMGIACSPMVGNGAAVLSAKAGTGGEGIQQEASRGRFLRAFRPVVRERTDRHRRQPLVEGISRNAVTWTMRGRVQEAWRATSNISASGDSRRASALMCSRIDALFASS